MEERFVSGAIAIVCDATGIALLVPLKPIQEGGVRCSSFYSVFASRIYNFFPFPVYSYLIFGRIWFSLFN